ncbi:MAG: hypothetical protein AB7U29_07480 [Desulfobulbus sp.]
MREGKAIVDAAFEVGFADQSHLHRAFYRRYGIDTATCRRQCVSGNGRR